MDIRLVVASVLVAGFLITAGNLVAAFFSVRKQVFVEEKRIADSKAFSEAENHEMSARPHDEVTAESSAAIHEKYEQLYAHRGLVRPSRGNATYLAAYEAKRMVALTLDSTRGNLIWAGIGLLVSTVAGVWSLWV